MKKLLLIFIFLSSFSFFSQTKKEKISIKYTNVSIEKALFKIEKKTLFTFYYKKEWLKDIRVSGKYKNAFLKVVLDDLFKNTIINYYITSDKKIILTQNNLIQDSFLESFFYEPKKDVTSVVKKKKETPKIIFPIKKPVLVLNNVKTIKVGKETKKSNQESYKLTGYIRNFQTKKPIPDLVLSVLNKKINVITNEKGFFELTLPAGVSFLKTRTLGYVSETKRVVMYNNGSLNFYLKEKSEMLDEIVVEIDKINNIKSVVSGITKIDVAKIKNIPLVLGERDILKVATTLPGITTAGEGSAGFNVRGGKTDQNLILLDDVVLYNPAHFFGLFSAINPFTTGKVIIYKGSIPAEYGGRLSSVFDIKTKEGNMEKFTLEGSFGPVTSNLMIETPVVKDKSSLIFGARGTYSGWILKALNDESLSKSNASFYDVVLKYKHNINEQNNVEGTVYYSKDKYSITSDSLFSYSNRLLSLRWNKVINDKNRGSVTFANSQYKFNIDYEGISNGNFNLGYKVNESQIKIKMKYNYNENHQFDYGVSSKLYVVNPGSITPKGTTSMIAPLLIQKDKALESALFFSDEYKINEKLSLGLGLRYSFFAALGASSQRVYLANLPKNESTLIEVKEYSNNDVIKTYGGPEIRVSGRYFLSESTSIKAGFNNTYQYIHTLSNNTTISPTDTWKLSDLNIKPQQSAQFSVGLFKNTEDNMYEFSIEGYYKKLKNMLDYKVGAELLLNTTIETEVIQGDGKAYGVEFLVRKTKGKLNGWLGYSFSRSFLKLDSDFIEEQVNNGNYFPTNFDKPHDLSIVANYKLTRRYSLSANFSYQTGRPVTYPVGNYLFNGIEYVAYSDRNKFRIPDYYRLDVGVNIEGNHKIKKLAHSFWNFSIYNVLGRNNPYSVFFVTENNEIKAYKSSIFSVPIPTLTYNIKF